MIATMTSLFLTILISLCTVPAWAATDEQKILVRDVIKLSGLQHEIQQLPQQVLAGFDQQGRKLPVEEHTALRQALATSFDAAMLERQITQELEASLRPEIIRATLKWLRSDLGQKVTKLEEAASHPKALEELRAFAKQLEKAPPAQDRIQLIRRIDQASNGTELLLDISESLALSVASAYEATLPAAQRTGLEQIRSQLARQRDTVRQQLQNHVWMSLLRTYRTLPQEELRQYVQFLETEEGLNFYTQSNIALKGALEISITRVSRTMMDILKPPAGRKAI